MQPLLRSFAFLSASLRLSFWFAYPLFCRAKLVGEFLRNVDGLLTVGLSSASCFMQQLNNVLPRGVELIRTIRLPAFRKWDCVAHTSPRSSPSNVRTVLSDTALATTFGTYPILILGNSCSSATSGNGKINKAPPPTLRPRLSVPIA